MVLNYVLVGCPWRGVKSNIQLLTVSLNKITKSLKKKQVLLPDGTFRRWNWSNTSCFSPKTALWLTLWRGSHCMSVCGSFLEVKWTFLLQMCCHIPDPFHLLGNSKGNRRNRKKTQVSQFSIPSHNFIKVLHFKVSVKDNEVPTEKNSSRASIIATKTSYISN